MTQVEKILYLLRGGPKTAKEIMFSKWSDQKSIANEWRTRISQLRAKDYVIKYDDKEGLYHLLAEPLRNKTIENRESITQELFPETRRTHAPPP